MGDYIHIQARIPACIQLIFPTGLKQARGLLAVYRTGTHHELAAMLQEATELDLALKFNF